jgi:hemerythrin
MTIVWHEKMSVGNALIDADHRDLLSLINSVELALRTHEPLSRAAKRAPQRDR